MNNTKLKKILSTLVSILLVLAVAAKLAAKLWFQVPVFDYYRASEKAFVIPDINRGFIPQGLCTAEDGRFLTTGYDKNGKASPLYLVKNGAKSAEKTVRLAKENGEPYTGHAGGVCYAGGRVYVADGGGRCLYVYDYDAILAAENGASVNAVGVFSTAVSKEDYVSPAFVTTDGEHLIVGEFYRENSYPTPDTHKFTTKAGDYTQALAVAYPLDASAPLGVRREAAFAYALPDLAQGMAFDGDKLYVSTSWGTSFSHIFVYDRTRLQQQEDLTVLGQTLPFYALDSASRTGDMKIAPMSEEIVVVDGKLYVMCESASDKYIFGKLTNADFCYATDLEKIKK